MIDIVRHFLITGALVAAIATGCGGASNMMCGEDPSTGLEQCYEDNNYGEAAITAGTATAVWGVTGCTVNGCEPPYVCNEKTKLCERAQCENDSGCPPGYHCDLKSLRCK